MSMAQHAGAHDVIPNASTIRSVPVATKYYANNAEMLSSGG